METQTLNLRIDEDETAWRNLIEWVVSNYKPGELISHELLKSKLLLLAPDIEDYDNTEDFVEALNLVQFEYMSLIDKMRWDILDNYKLYLLSERGRGYSFITPCDQVNYAFETTIKEIKKAIKEGSLIASNRRFDNSSQEQLSKDNDLLAKMGMMKQLFAGIK